MTRKVIRTDDAPAPVGPYNQAIVATGQMVFVAGQIPLDPISGTIVSENDIAQQTEQVLKNLQAILEAAGASMADIVKTTVYLADIDDFIVMNAVYERFFDAENAPARAAFEVARLPKDVKIEIECIAVIPD